MKRPSTMAAIPTRCLRSGTVRLAFFAIALWACTALRSPHEPPSVAAQSTALPETYALQGVWGTAVDRQGPDHPTGIDFDDQGRLYVAEPSSARISVWRSSGERVATWGGAALGLVQPVDVAVDVGRDRVYVAEPDARRVRVLARSDGSVLDVYAEVGRPRGLAVDDQGRLYVADEEAGRVLVFDPEGQPLAVWGAGDDPAQPDADIVRPAGLDWDNGRLFVADRGKLRIEVLDDAGLPLPDLRVDLSGIGDAGGLPLDVAVADGVVHVAAEHAVLRTRIGGTRIAPLPTIEEFLPNECSVCRLCADVRELVANHEGVRGVAAHSSLGVAFSFAPQLRGPDRIVLHPPRGEARIIPSTICLPEPARQLHNPSRIDAGEMPELVHVLDRSGGSRVLDGGGDFFDATRGRERARGVDIAADGRAPYHTAVLSGTQNVGLVDSLRCFLGCGAAEVVVADPVTLMRRNLVGERVPDLGWWHRALAAQDVLAVLDAGRGRVVLRQGFPCGSQIPFCTDRSCIASQSCPVNPVERALIGGVSLGAARDAVKAYSDLAYDGRGTLWVLARDGAVRGIDTFGRDAGDTRLEGWGRRGAEALAADSTAFYVLDQRGDAYKFDQQGGLLAAWRPALDAGPGVYQDIAVAPDGRVMIVDSAGDRVVVYGQAIGPAEPPNPAGAAACTPLLDKQASPSELLVGESAELTLSLTVRCQPKDIVIAVDGSCQMSGDRLAAARAAAGALIEELDTDRDRVAIALFDDRPGVWTVLAPLGADVEALRDAAAGIPTACRPVQLFPDRRNDARNAEGLRAGRMLLGGPESRSDAQKHLLLVSASTIDRELVEALHGRRLANQRLPEVEDRTHALFEARALWSSGVHIHTAALGMPDRPLGPPPDPTPDLQSSQPPDEGLLAALALPPSAHLVADPPHRLAEQWRALARGWRTGNALDAVAIEDRLPDDMLFVPGSDRPTGMRVSDGVRWEIGRVGDGERITRTLRVTATRAGLRPTNTEARASWSHDGGAVHEALFPVPHVLVREPAPSATPTPRTTASATAAPTAEPSAIPPTIVSLPATGTPPPPTPALHGPAYLPAVLQYRCKPVAVALDVVLLIDSSSSMQGEKIERARMAAGVFLSLLELGRDRAALVTFDQAARVDVGLTGDEELLRTALADVRTDVGTRIDLGLITAHDLLRSNERPRTDSTVVLLTDGQPELGSESEAVRVARLLRAGGIQLWAIGLGRDVPIDLLEAMTGDPTRVRLAPAAGDLVAVYEAIARLLPCR